MSQRKHIQVAATSVNYYLSLQLNLAWFPSPTPQQPPPPPRGRLLPLPPLLPTRLLELMQNRGTTAKVLENGRDSPCLLISDSEAS